MTKGLALRDGDMSHRSRKEPRPTKALDEGRGNMKWINSRAS